MSTVASLHLLIVSGYVFPGFVDFCVRKIITVIARLSTILEITLDTVLAGPVSTPTVCKLYTSNSELFPRESSKKTTFILHACQWDSNSIPYIFKQSILKRVISWLLHYWILSGTQRTRKEVSCSAVNPSVTPCNPIPVCFPLYQAASCLGRDEVDYDCQYADCISPEYCALFWL